MSQIYLDDQGVFREFELTGREIEKAWDGKVSLSDISLRKIARDPNTKIKLIEGTVEGYIDVTSDTTDEGGNFLRKSTKRQRGYNYILYESDTNHVGLQEDLEISPWVVFRWSVSPEEIYGRGMAMQCLEDITTLNRLRINLLDRSTMESKPNWLADQSAGIDITKLNNKSGQVIPYKRVIGSNTLPLIPLSLPPASVDTYNMVKDLTDRVNETMFSRSVVKERPTYQTATEVSMDREEEFKRLGASLERVKFECLNNLLNSTLHILIKEKIVGGLDTLTKDDWSIRYRSPYVGVQDQEDLLNIKSFIEMVQGVYGVETAMATVKMSKLVPQIAKLSGVESEYILSSGEWAELSQKMNKVYEDSLEKQQ